MCLACDWEATLQHCDDLLDDSDYEFASDTVSGIRDWIEDNEHVTNRQQDALSNIENSKH